MTTESPSQPQQTDWANAPGFEPAVDVKLEVEMAAARERVFRAITQELSAWFGPGGGSNGFRMTLEPFAGGRMWRDLGEAGGHLWGLVQVIKPPHLLEICGPMFVSAPSLSHLSFRLHETDGGGTRLEFRHLAMGCVPAAMRDGISEGWQSTLTKELKHHVERNH
ncbi:MAG: SRPBCC domain-containing protein [Planctomycetota bacterium]